MILNKMLLCAVALQQSEVLRYVWEQYYTKGHTLEYMLDKTGLVSSHITNNLESYYVLVTVGWRGEESAAKNNDISALSKQGQRHPGN